MGPPLTGLDEAVAALDAEGIVAFPTETVIGIGARLDRPEAVRRLFTVKDRPTDKALQVLVASVAAIDEIAEFPRESRRLAERFMPGPLTLVLPARRPLPGLGAAGTVGVRVPAHPAPRALCERAGILAATSANRSGEPTPATVAGVREVLGAEVDAYVEGGPAPAGTASTVLAVTHDGCVLLREGALDVVELEAVLGERARRGW